MGVCRARWPTTAYFWGDEIGKGNASCTGCGGEGVGIGTENVGRFDANAFGLHDMHGNVEEWVEDCWQDSYAGHPPTDGSAWTEGNCNQRVVRNGSWFEDPLFLRSAARRGYDKKNHGGAMGFRVGRTLAP
jgi:formylglycine-generating enzyme required for sulfatase activity